LKQWIEKPSKNLRAVWRSVKLALDHQLDEIKVYRSQQKSGNSVRIQNEFFASVIGKITPHALSKLNEQWILYKDEERRLTNGDITSICSGTYYRSIGIPCWHMVKERLSQRARIQPNDFHPHWHWYRPPPGAERVEYPLPILDPKTRQQRRTIETERRAHARAHAAVRRATTGRILSQHEQL